jgi:aldehyde dehydrogenase (NAD+)
LRWRREQLDGLIGFLSDCERPILQALSDDLGKPSFEGFASDVGGVLAEVKTIRRLMPRQMRPRKVRTPLMSQPASSYLYPEPLGAVLVMPAWNYPVGLAVLPTAGALAAGNTVAVKTSEVAPASAQVLAEHLPRFVDPEGLTVFSGGPEVARELLRHRFGHIHYTGNSRIGREVMAAAARHLTPVTLELGGKNPAYVHRDADLATSARRIMWGRLFNAGQTCVSPDYVLVDREVEQPLIEQMARWVRATYGPAPQRSSDLARIINDRHFNRITGLLKGAGEVIVGGDFDAAARYIAPTILRNVADDHPLMQDEIFGPIISVTAVAGPEEAARRIAARPQPLSMYIFTRDNAVTELLVSRTSAGSVLVNHVFVHAFNSELPFGGVGESGMGTYTGKHSFDCFTHWKPVMRSRFRPDPPLLYPPYTRWKNALVHRVFS